jgi:hypothetical protein
MDGMNKGFVGPNNAIRVANMGEAVSIDKDERMGMIEDAYVMDALFLSAVRISFGGDYQVAALHAWFSS